MKKRFSGVNIFASIVLYVFALLSIIYGIVQIKYCYDDVSQALAGGMTITGNVYTIFDYYMSTCSQSLFWGFLLAAVGWILMQKALEAKAASGTTIVNKNEAEAFENEPSTILGVYADNNDTEQINNNSDSGDIDNKDNSNNNDNNDIERFTQN